MSLLKRLRGWFRSGHNTSDELAAEAETRRLEDDLEMRRVTERQSSRQILGR